MSSINDLIAMRKKRPPLKYCPDKKQHQLNVGESYSDRGTKFDSVNVSRHKNGYYIFTRVGAGPFESLDDIPKYKIKSVARHG